MTKLISSSSVHQNPAMSWGRSKNVGQVFDLTEKSNDIVW